MRKAQIILTGFLILLAAPAMAAMDGSTGVVIGPGTALPGDTVTFMFYITNGSPDGEATSAVHFRFPETFQITDAWFDDEGAGWDFAWSSYGDFDEYVVFYDNDNDPDQGEILPGQGGTFYVQLTISPNTNCGVYDLVWKQYGDGTGAHHHWTHGEVPYDICGIATEEATWSSVKSLY